MRSTLILLLILVVLNACSGLGPDAEKELLQADREFGQYAINNGLNEAFIEYAADGLILLRHGDFPLLDKETLQDRIVGQKLSEQEQEHVLMQWEPVKAEAAQSNDFGYTYGRWAVKADSSSQSLIEGNYVTVWKRSADGNWGIVLDAGTIGPGEARITSN